MDEFKEFLKTIPSIKQDVLNGRYTWQQLYEIFVMYGKDDKFWQPYKTGNNFDLNILIHYKCTTFFGIMQEIRQLFYKKNKKYRQNLS